MSLAAGPQGEVWPVLCTITHALLAGNKSSSLTLLRHSRRQKAELNSALSSAVTLLRLAALFHRRRRRRLSSLPMRALGVGRNSFTPLHACRSAARTSKPQPRRPLPSRGASHTHPLSARLPAVWHTSAIPSSHMVPLRAVPPPGRAWLARSRSSALGTPSLSLSARLCVAAPCSVRRLQRSTCARPPQQEHASGAELRVLSLPRPFP